MSPNATSQGPLAQADSGVHGGISTPSYPLSPAAVGVPPIPPAQPSGVDQGPNCIDHYVISKISESCLRATNSRPCTSALVEPQPSIPNRLISSRTHSSAICSRQAQNTFLDPQIRARQQRVGFCIMFFLHRLRTSSLSHSGVALVQLPQLGFAAAAIISTFTI